MIIKPFFVEKTWGGHYLSELFDLREKKKLGEAWIVSTLEEGESEIESVVLSKHLGERLPYLIKIIEAAENLSVQVHPDDIWASKLENSKGKTECWYILKVEPEGGIFLGLKSDVDKDLFFSKIKKQESVKDMMNFIPVQAGDFIEVPAGTIHAIGSGVTLLEFQQASGITYRLWDWERSGRQLHLEKGELVTQITSQKSIINVLDFEIGGFLFNHSDFNIQKLGSNTLKCFSSKSKFSTIIDLNTLRVTII